MYCTNCGAALPPNAGTCSACGHPVQAGGSYPGGIAGSGGPPRLRIPNYLVQAILVTIFCCQPFGIVAIVYAAQVDGRAAGGDYEGATRASNSAKMWCWIAFGLGFAVMLIYGLIMIGVALKGDGHMQQQPIHFQGVR
jgi:interferon-induced transmembrane protein/zinc ribbon protein